MKRGLIGLVVIAVVCGVIPSAVAGQSTGLAVHGFLTQGCARPTDVPL